jgi:hypothetical protein
MANTRYYIARLGDSMLYDDDDHIILFTKASDAILAACEQWGVSEYIFVEEGIVK